MTENSDKTITLNASRELELYLRFKARGYRTLWVGEGKVCLQAPKDLDIPNEPHASDCAIWVQEPCSCITGNWRKHESTDV